MSDLLAKDYPTVITCASSLTRFYDHLRTLPFSSAQENGLPRRGRTCGRAAAMRVSLKRELARTNVSPRKHQGRQSHYRQSRQLLPTHSANILATGYYATLFFAHDPFGVELANSLATLKLRA